MSLSRLLRRAFSTSVESDSKPTIRSISRDLYEERSLKQLVQRFKKSSEHERFRTKIGIYKVTVHRLASAKRYNWIEEILEDQKKYKDISKEGFSARLIYLYGKSGMFEHAQKVFDEMPDRNCERTALSLGALLGACVNSKKFGLVSELFEELPKKLSIEPDLVSYNTIVKAFCEMDSFDSAVSVLDKMEKKGVEPNLITFNTLLNGLYGKGQFADGEKIWERMEKKNVAPNVRSYNAKLRGLALEKKTKEAVELVEEMKSKDVKPDVFSFNAVIKGYMNEGNLEEAKRWYNEIERSALAPDRRIFEMLIPFVCEKGEVELAFELCEETFKRKLLVDASLLQLVVDGLVKESKIEEAKKLEHLGKFNQYRRYSLKLPSDE
ncbi:small ribosomal subunit protein mS78 (rPPR3a)-like [Alnus glutinosa]|uniref:small ribosomal subunit protein mS78 (rPPR3a)-like n=1 Tax=Alnus glutinosa TaxID=3517 RepID=UPI002D77F6F7|nr:small ribosomal subunit protein mS78 (rPPR3a)-like [Alnus glutinosa]